MRLFLNAAAAVFVLTTIFSCSTTSDYQQRLVLQGNELAKDGLLREAADTYQKALKQKPSDKSARRNLGIVLVKLKNYRSASRQLEKIIAYFEDDFETNFWLAESLRAQEKHAEAIYRYQKSLEIRPKELRASKALAWSYYKIRFYSEAFAITNALMKTNPSDGQLAIITARIYLKTNKPDAALDLMQKSSKGVDAQQLPYFQSVEGDAFLAMNKCNEAIQSYRNALRAQPLLPGPLVGLGRCHLEVGKNSIAIGYLERALRIKPRFTEAAYLLAKAYQDSDRSKANKYFKHFQKLAVNDPEWLPQMSRIHSELSRLDHNTKFKPK